MQLLRSDEPRGRALRAIAHPSHRPVERFGVADQFGTRGKHVGVDSAGMNRVDLDAISEAL